MREIFESVKNWGRWGADDEAGALNLIDDEVRRVCEQILDERRRTGNGG